MANKFIIAVLTLLALVGAAALMRVMRRSGIEESGGLLSTMELRLEDKDKEISKLQEDLAQQQEMSHNLEQELSMLKHTLVRVQHQTADTAGEQTSST
jgi:septal ring factor EnvC (AmiA/AmiB activator)